MSGVILDTHTWAWTIHSTTRLSSPARGAIEGADSVQVGPISFFEIGQKVRMGKWPEMAQLVEGLHEILDRQGAVVAPLTADICLAASTMDWDRHDPFDRIIAATALTLGLPLVTRDPVFDGLEGLRSIW